MDMTAAVTVHVMRAWPTVTHTAAIEHLCSCIWMRCEHDLQQQRTCIHDNTCRSAQLCCDSPAQRLCGPMVKLWPPLAKRNIWVHHLLPPSAAVLPHNTPLRMRCKRFGLLHPLFILDSASPETAWPRMLCIYLLGREDYIMAWALIFAVQGSAVKCQHKLHLCIGMSSNNGARRLDGIPSSAIRACAAPSSCKAFSLLLFTSMRLR